MVAQRGQTLGQNPAYRPSDILPLFEGLSFSQICERGTGLYGWSFAADNLRDLFFLCMRHSITMSFVGRKRKVCFGLIGVGKQTFGNGLILPTNGGSFGTGSTQDPQRRA